MIVIYFTRGKVVDIYWRNRPEAKKLANTLIRKDLLTKEEASLALDHQKKSIQRLGTIQELTLHTVEVMRLISTMTEGVFQFNTQSLDEIKSPVSQNLSVLPSGKLPHNPSELIGSNGTTFLMGLLRKKFDFIILDTPPVLPATDGMLMAPRTDGTILVVKSGNTVWKVIKEVVESFKNAQLPILGTILNFVDLKKEGYYRYYKKYYSSYYGD